MSAKPKVVVVMPANNAAKTLRMPYAELPRDVGDLMIVVAGSSDETALLARYGLHSLHWIRQRQFESLRRRYTRVAAHRGHA